MSKTSSFGTTKRESHDSSAFYSQFGDAVFEDKITEPQPPNPDAINKIFCGNSTAMPELADDSVGLCVTSPPYFCLKEYEQELTFDQYQEMLRLVWTEVYRVLEPGGRAVINIVGIGRKPYVPLHHIVTQQMLDLGFLMRGEIIWQKSKGMSGNCAWGTFRSPQNPTLRDIHETLLVFSKGRMSRAWKGTSTISTEEFMDSSLSTWYIEAEHASRVNHPAPFPVELPRRLINFYSYVEDLILDPFMGSGTTAVAAVKLGRCYVGYDAVPEYVELAERRVAAVLAETPWEGDIQ